MSRLFPIFEVYQTSKIMSNLDNPTEVWKPIIGYEGIYLISNTKNIKSLSRKSGYYDRGESIRKATLHHSGYYIIQLHKNGLRKFYPLHRLLAIAFIPNPNNLPQINHKDGNKLNNDIDNLEWCNQQYNTIHAYKLGLAKSGINHKQSKSVLQIKDGLLIKKWDCINSAQRHFGKANNGSVCKALKDNRKSAYGFKWEYA